MDDLRVCIVAEHASKRFGGEAILPYHFFRGLRARGVDAYLIVHERTREELQTLFPDDLDRLRFVEDMALQKLFYRIGILLPRRISEATFGLANQFLTQYAQRAFVRSLASPTTVVHQPIPVSPRFPSLLWNVGAPIVIGPMNGGMDFPPAFRRTESALSRLAISIGRSFSNIGNRLLPGKLRAAVLLVANERTRQALPAGARGKIILLPENGVDLSQWASSPNTTDGNGRFLFIGRLVDWKALDIAIEALAQVPGATLDIVGDGSMLGTWQQKSVSLGLTDRIHFHGWLSQPECATLLRDSTALVLPSIYECGGAVVLEAMATSKPVIATNWGGPADYLDASSGVLISPVDRATLINGFAEAMRELLASPTTAREMGESGRRRVLAEFDWDKKIEAMLEVYRSVVAGQPAN